jgi:hypothetical protein
MDELQAEFMKMLSTQNVQHQKQMEQLEVLPLDLYNLIYQNVYRPKTGNLRRS